MATTPATAQARAVTPKQAAAILGVHEETIRRMTRRGDLPSVKIGRHVRIPIKALEGMLTVKPQDEVAPDDR